MLSQEVSEFLLHFQAGTHAVLFYDTQDAKREILFNHLKFGQDRQGLAYVCSEETPQEIREKMTSFGLDAESVHARSSLTIKSYDEVYIMNGAVNIPEIVSRFSRMVDTSRAQGLNGLRAGAEMSCFFKHGKVEELIAYENALQRKFSFMAQGICAYNIAEMNSRGFLGVMMPLVRAHDPVIFASPSGFVLVKPEKVGKKHLEMMLVN